MMDQRDLLCDSAFAKRLRLHREKARAAVAARSAFGRLLAMDADRLHPSDSIDDLLQTIRCRVGRSQMLSSVEFVMALEDAVEKRGWSLEGWSGRFACPDGIFTPREVRDLDLGTWIKSRLGPSDRS